MITLAELIKKCAVVSGLGEAGLLEKYLGEGSVLSLISDTRDQTLQLMRQLEVILPDRRPRIVIGFAPPFYPAISYRQFETSLYDKVERGIRRAAESLRGEAAGEDHRQSAAADVKSVGILESRLAEEDNRTEGTGDIQTAQTSKAATAAAGGGEVNGGSNSGGDGGGEIYRLDGEKELKVKTFYPYISDLSYLALPYSDFELGILKDNMPALGKSDNVPLEMMRDRNCSVINLGAYGCDAHKWTERVERDYSFRLLPHLLAGIVKELLGS